MEGIDVRQSQPVCAGIVETPAQLQQHIAAELKIAECMRAHGVTGFPDPSATGLLLLLLLLLLPTSVADEAGYVSAATACGAPSGAPAQSVR